LEWAVVLLILELITATVSPLINGRIALARLESTRAKEEQIRTALITYVAQNSRLPCPAVETRK
jgi:type II secretory pathway pseudopilin PulG